MKARLLRALPWVLFALMNVFAAYNAYGNQTVPWFWMVNTVVAILCFCNAVYHYQRKPDNWAEEFKKRYQERYGKSIYDDNEDLQ